MTLDGLKYFGCTYHNEIQSSLGSQDTTLGTAAATWKSPIVQIGMPMYGTTSGGS